VRFGNGTIRSAYSDWGAANASRQDAGRRAILDYTTIACGGKRYVRKAEPAIPQRIMIPIIGDVVLDDSLIEERFILASGPGGQNVNKVASAVQLRLDLRGQPALPDPVRARAARLAGRRLTQDGILVITARRFRTRERNRRDALGRLVALLRRAAVAPAIRRRTRPTAASRERRLQQKARRAALKEQRRGAPGDGPC
jgi:ribosome-associated protein